MAKQMIEDLKEGEKIQSYFLVREKAKNTTRAGKPYLSIDLIDRTGQINAKVWDNAEKLAKTFEKGDAVLVRAFVDSFQGKLQLKASDIHAVDPDNEDELDQADLIPHTPCDIDELWQKLTSFIDSIEDQDIKALLEKIFTDDKVGGAFKKGTAARDMHHNYVGGLIEHTISVTEICSLLCEHYGSEINRDVTIAGGLLHDIGKIIEIDVESDFNYTVEGSLKGHIIIGVEIVGRFAGEMEDFPAEKRLLIEHLIISHQGQKEWSSPIEPKIPEAQILHVADLTDARVFQMLRAIRTADNPDDPFTYRVPALGRSVLKVRDAEDLKGWMKIL